MMRRILIAILFFSWVGGYAQKARKTAFGIAVGRALTAEIRPALFSTTMVMVHDVVNPPAASRYYAYMMLAAYDLVAEHDTALVAPGVFIQRYPSFKLPDSGDYRIAAVYAILETGRQMLPSGYLLEKEERDFLGKLHEWGVSQGMVDRSIAAAQAAVGKVITFSRADR